MSAVDLALLGLVYDRSLSAYEIQKDVEYRNLSRWVKISSPSIYKKVIQLEEKGYLTSRSVRESKMPEKTIYTITPAGKEYFSTLMKDIADAPVNIIYDFNAIIVNLKSVPKEEALGLITTIQANFKKSKDYLEQMISLRGHIPLIGRTIMQQQLQIYESLLSWIGAFKKEFEAEKPEV